MKDLSIGSSSCAQCVIVFLIVCPRVLVFIPDGLDLWSPGRYVGSYRGLLSGVTVRPGTVEPHSVVECLYACREGLDFGDLETLGSGMKVTPREELEYRLV